MLKMIIRGFRPIEKVKTVSGTIQMASAVRFHFMGTEKYLTVNIDYSKPNEKVKGNNYFSEGRARVASKKLDLTNGVRIVDLRNNKEARGFGERLEGIKADFSFTVEHFNPRDKALTVRDLDEPRLNVHLIKEQLETTLEESKGDILIACGSRNQKREIKDILKTLSLREDMKIFIAEKPALSISIG